MNYSTDSFLPNVPVQLSCGKGNFEYRINPAHRDTTQHKSKWIINCKEEVYLFAWAVEWDSMDGVFYWGIVLDGTRVCPLGITESNRTSKIARFVPSNVPCFWHGYPVDYETDPTHDRPGRPLLLKWVEAGYMTKPAMMRLIRGKGWKD